jgi:integrase
MALYKRKKLYWTDVTVNGIRYREPLETRDWREAQTLERERVTQLKERAPDPEKRCKNFGAMDIATAMKAYIAERRAQVSPRMVAYWKEQEITLSRHFKTLALKRITPGHIADYQNWRISQAKAPKTTNGEISVLRQLLKHARLWYRLAQDYKPVPNTRPPVGRALSQDEQAKLFETAALWKPGSPPIIKEGKDGKTYKIQPDWMYAHAAAVLAAYCGLRACEIKGLQWKDVDLRAGLLDIRRSKTPGGWRTPTLNTICSETLAGLYENARVAGTGEPDHQVFPTGWRSAGRSILKEAGIKARFHDLRHTAVTMMAEKGLPDLTIMAQVGHVSPAMMKTYSHIRRQALNQAAAALEPNFQKGPAIAEMVN